MSGVVTFEERTKRLVEEALKNAKENGYDMAGFSLRDIAIDMLAYDAFGYDEDVPTAEQIIVALKSLGIEGD